jgi:hypothetical protein
VSRDAAASTSRRQLGVPNPRPVRAMADRFVRDDEHADGGDEGESRERRDRDGGRDQDEQHAATIVRRRKR